MKINKQIINQTKLRRRKGQKGEKISNEIIIALSQPTLIKSLYKNHFKCETNQKK